MAVFRYILLAVLLQVVIDKSECSVKFSSKPRAINVADGSPLKLKCMFSLRDEKELLKNQKVKDMEIQSISISKHAQERGQHQIAFIHSLNPDTPKILTTANENQDKSPAVIASGKIQQSGANSQSEIQPELSHQTSSFLAIEFNSPKPTDSGEYSCVVTVINKHNGLPHVFTKQIDLPDESIVGLAHELDSLPQTLEKDFEQLEADYEAHLADKMKTLENKYEKQLQSLTIWKEKVVEYFIQDFMFVRSTEYNNRTYAVSNFKIRNIDLAKSMCEFIDGHIFEFDDQEEWNFVTSFLKNTFPGKAFYVGASDVLKEGEFRWMHSNKTMAFAPWGHGEPNDGEGNEDCVEIATKHGIYSLNDVACSYSKRSWQSDGTLCEIPNKID